MGFCNILFSDGLYPFFIVFFLYHFLLEDSFVIISKEVAMRKSLTQQVVEKLTEEVRSERLSPGDRIPNEFELASRMNVSRSTVREAVKQLVSQGVFEIRRGDGTYVCQHIGVKPDPLGLQFISDRKKLALDLCEVRLVLEPWMVRLAAERASDEAIAEMERLQKEVEERIMRGENHAEPDIALHVCWAKCTGNTVVPKIIPILMEAIPLFIEVTKASLLQPTITTHREIIAAIKAHDPEKAAASMESHILFNRVSIQKTDF